jgi:hypothetical protein
MRHFMLGKPHLRRLFALIERYPFPVRRLSQPGQIPPPRTGFEQLLLESLALLTA